MLAKLTLLVCFVVLASAQVSTVSTSVLETTYLNSFVVNTAVSALAVSTSSSSSVQITPSMLSALYNELNNNASAVMQAPQDPTVINTFQTPLGIPVEALEAAVQYAQSKGLIASVTAPSTLGALNSALQQEAPSAINIVAAYMLNANADKLTAVSSFTPSVAAIENAISQYQAAPSVVVDPALVNAAYQDLSSLNALSPTTKTQVASLVPTVECAILDAQDSFVLCPDASTALTYAKVATDAKWGPPYDPDQSILDATESGYYYAITTSGVVVQWTATSPSTAGQ
jgi:hypothetical protein